MDNHINGKFNLKLKTHKHISNHLHKPSLEPPPLKERTQHDPASPPGRNTFGQPSGEPHAWAIWNYTPIAPQTYPATTSQETLLRERVFGKTYQKCYVPHRSTMKFHKIIKIDPLSLYPPCVIPQFRDSFQKRRPQSSNTDSLERIPRKHVVQTTHVGQKLNLHLCWNYAAHDDKVSYLQPSRI